MVRVLVRFAKFPFFLLSKFSLTSSLFCFHREVQFIQKLFDNILFPWTLPPLLSSFPVTMSQEIFLFLRYSAIFRAVNSPDWSLWDIHILVYNPCSIVSVILYDLLLTSARLLLFVNSGDSFTGFGYLRICRRTNMFMLPPESQLCLGISYW